MSDITNKVFKAFEPLKENRFVINVNKEVNIPEYLFRKFHIENVGEDFIFTTEIYQTVEYTFNPADLTKITTIILKFLVPVGDLVGGLHMLVKGSNMEMVGDYGNDELLNVKFRFVIKPEDINLLCQDIKKEGDGK
jgi:hypothetical protein